jgi:hypothetical protein
MATKNVNSKNDATPAEERDRKQDDEKLHEEIRELTGHAYRSIKKIEKSQEGAEENGVEQFSQERQSGDSSDDNSIIDVSDTIHADEEEILEEESSPDGGGGEDDYFLVSGQDVAEVYEFLRKNNSGNDVLYSYDDINSMQGNDIEGKPEIFDEIDEWQFYLMSNSSDDEGNRLIDLPEALPVGGYTGNIFVNEMKVGVATNLANYALYTGFEDTALRQAAATKLDAEIGRLSEITEPTAAEEEALIELQTKYKSFGEEPIGAVTSAENFLNIQEASYGVIRASDYLTAGLIHTGQITDPFDMDENEIALQANFIHELSGDEYAENVVLKWQVATQSVPVQPMKYQKSWC